MRTAFIFPAFISEYLGNEIQLLDDLSSNFSQFQEEISLIMDDNFINFSTDDVKYTEDELRSQVISYLFSCSLSETLIKKGLKPDFMAGYSMGLYAALYTGKAISFGEGIQLIKKAFELSKIRIENIESGMGSIIGLKQNEIEEIIQQHDFEAEIANTNSEHSHLISGPKEGISNVLVKAREIGALNVSMLNVETPYHSRLLEDVQIEFEQFISGKINIKVSDFTLISAIDQRELTTIDQIITEITNNLYKRINWMNTFEKLVNVGVNEFVECGAGKSLQKIGRFLPGDFTIYPMNKVSQLLS